MRKFQIIRRIDDGQLTPSNWWGLCWYEDYDAVRVIAPIPLNLVLVLARWLHAWFAYKWSQKILRGAQFSRRQHKHVVNRLFEIRARLDDSRVESKPGADGLDELTCFFNKDLPTIDYAIGVLQRDLRRVGRGR